MREPKEESGYTEFNCEGTYKKESGYTEFNCEGTYKKEDSGSMEFIWKFCIKDAIS